MTKRTLVDGSPVYDSWAEALDDPGLDLSRPWHVASRPESGNHPPALQALRWPAGWEPLGAIRDPEES